MMQPQQKHPDDLFLITREELDRCCNQMSISGYKVSANYVEAMVISRPHTQPERNKPCEEQGCTDTENCDEICEHSRIYSPAWVKEHDAAIRKVERERVLDKYLDELQKEIGESMDYIDWDSVEAVYIRVRGEP